MVRASSCRPQGGHRTRVADAVAQRRRPEGLSEEAQAIDDFVSQLLADQDVSDEAFDAVKRHFGEKGVVDLTGVVGYYTFLAMQLNVARCPVPPDGARLPRD